MNINISAYDNSDEYPLANITVNGVIICQDLPHPYTCQWNTSEFEDGINIINAEITDGSGNSRALYPISVNLNNYGIPDSIPPSVVILVLPQMKLLMELFLFLPELMTFME